MSSDDALLLLRHGTDVPILRSDLNPPLDYHRLDEFQELVSDVVSLCCSKDNIRLSYSDRLRARQSAEILLAGLDEKKTVEMCGTGLIREVYHGHFKIINHKQGDIYPPLVDAWSLWAEVLADMDIDYRYGNPVRKGEIPFPSLSGIFTKFGENHREFTIRLYAFLIDLIDLHYSDGGSFNIVLAHQATLSRIQRVFNALNSMDDIPPEGKLVRKIERSSNRVNIKESHGVVIVFPPLDFSVNVLKQEIEHMKK